jgi:hypothetical protein
MAAPNPDVQFQLLVLSYLLFCPSDLHDNWITATSNNDFPSFANVMAAMGFTDTAIQETSKLFTQGKLTKPALSELSAKIAQLPLYDGGGAHPIGTQAGLLVRIAKSMDRK